MSTFDLKLVGANLRYLRTQLQLSREKVAEYVGISTSTVSLLERGEGGVPGSDLTYNLAALFGVTMEDLLQTDLTKLPVFNQVVDQLRQCSEDEAELIVAVGIRLVHRRGDRGFFRQTPPRKPRASARGRAKRQASGREPDTYVAVDPGLDS